MDLSEIAKKLELSDSKLVVRKAAELRRLCDVHFDSSIIGVGEICKAVICLEIAASRLGVLFDRSCAVRLSGISEKAYTRFYNSLHNSLGVNYKDRFLSSLPASRRASADFTRPLKVDKLKLIELCGTSDSEFSSVFTSMKDLCHNVFGIAKEKKDSKEVKSNRDPLGVLPGKRKPEDGGYLSDGGPETSSYKKRKQMEKPDYEDWKSSMLTSKNRIRAEVPCKRAKQTHLNFPKVAAETQKLEAM